MEVKPLWLELGTKRVTLLKPQGLEMVFTLGDSNLFSPDYK
jgi:hypothetical protein